MTDRLTVDKVNNEISRLYTLLGKTFLNEDCVVPKEQMHIVSVFLERQIAFILLYAEDISKTYDEIQKIMKSSDMYDLICPLVSIETAHRDAVIRKDFASAFKKVKCGRDLSRALGWSFSDRDIIELAKLHKAGRFRTKIEDLLEDCNFHEECGAFSNGEYSEWL